MDLHDPKVIIGGSVIGIALLYYFYKPSAASQGNGMGPALVTYVSPGNRDANITDTASSSTASDSSAMAAALQASSAHSDDTNASVLNTESSLGAIQSLVNSQVSKLPFKTDYGFHSTVHGALTMNSAGAPTFDFTSNFAPNDQSAAGARITRLTTSVRDTQAKLRAANERIRALTHPQATAP